MSSAGQHPFQARRRWFVNLFATAATLCTCLAWTSCSEALTVSIGEPYRGRLVNGIPFPLDMGGYKVRDPELSYATPELIGSLLDAIEVVRERYPNTVDLFIGDFSAADGGRLKGHKSHQNGRDVDLGMYALGNQPLDQFIPMHAGNLDVPKTWTLIEGLIRTGRVQYLFVDRRIQKMLFEYALSRGFDEDLLNRLFNDVGHGSADAAIRHEPRHNDHIHVRFDAPWSSLAAQIDPSDIEKRNIIELAQAGFLPKKVLYYVDKHQSDLPTLAQSFGVRPEDLARWNHLPAHARLAPGTPLVYYRRAFELEPVHLAESLRLRHLIPLEPVRVASVASLPPVDVSSWVRSEVPKSYEKTHTVRRGETLQSVARLHGLTRAQLARMNNLNEKQALRPGSKLIVARTHSGVDNLNKWASSPSSRTLQGNPSAAASSEKSLQKSARTHVVQKGDTLAAIAKKYGVTVSDLLEWNKLSSKIKLTTGMSLTVSPPEKETKVAPQPASKTASQKENSNTAKEKAAPQKAPQAVPLQKTTTEKGTSSRDAAQNPDTKASNVKKNQPAVHTVAPGDTLNAISRKYNVEMKDILSANKISDAKKLKPGLKLKIPERS
ncbi:MAG: penicillin-insensitive murein endopeptidase [Desulfosoma sp.]